MTKLKDGDDNSKRMGEGKMHVLRLACLVLSVNCFAVSLFMSDFDGTLVETRKHQGKIGKFNTPMKLVLRELSRWDMEKAPLELEREIEIAGGDFFEIYDRLYTEAGKRKYSLRPYTLSDGRVIVPYYYQVYPRTFDYFYESKENFLLRDLKVGLAKENKDNWKGPLFDHAMKYLSEMKTNKFHKFGIITARAHSDQEWTQFFKELKKSYKDIQIPDIFHNVSRPEEIVLEESGPTREVNITARKVARLEEIALELNEVPLDYSEEILDADGDERRFMHTLIFADDNQDILNQTFKHFSNLMRAKRLPFVKVVIVNAGFDQEVFDSGRPRAVVVQNDGTYRKATAVETMGEIKGLKASKVPNIKSCLMKMTKLSEG